MCDYCEDASTGRPVGIDLGLLAAARAIEAAMPGEAAEDQAWEIFAGRAGGGVPWNDLQRIMTSYEAAASRAALRPRRRGAGGGGDFRCEAAPRA